MRPNSNQELDCLVVMEMFKTLTSVCKQECFSLRLNISETLLSFSAQNLIEFLFKNFTLFSTAANVNDIKH